MSVQTDIAVDALSHRFLLDYPREAARELERLTVAETAPVLANEPAHVLRSLWDYLVAPVADELLLALPQELALQLLLELDPGRAAASLMRMDEDSQAHYLALLDKQVAADLRRLMTYPPESAGALMDTRIAALRPDITVGEALQRLRQRRPRSLRSVYLVDEEQRLQALVDIEDLALADDARPLRELSRPLTAVVSAIDPRDAVVDLLQQQHIEELPVVDISGHLLGVIRAAEMIRALKESSSANLQTMVGVSKDERALSPVGFAVRKRLPWMHINLITAFMAAAVVGLFEDTIAQFTALAVLMPVVAGMSGNMGAQALAVTIRGLALREIGIRQWLRVFFKEVRVGLFNGTAIALTTAVVVFLWSGSSGLALVIGLAMVISMSLACVAGAMVPILLTRFGQDPAQSSSILLTTVTDITGFMSFLGIATLLSNLLV